MQAGFTETVLNLIMQLCVVCIVGFSVLKLLMQLLTALRTVLET